ncbi:MAG: precorrin-3B C(17)-methyltransferase [Gemmatimonadota bacterium]
MIGLVAVTAAGRAAAGRLASAWPGETRCYEGPAARALPAAWAECDGLVCFLAAGAVIRLIAPLLADKHTDPAVVCVDEATRYAVALTGGHAGGASAGGANGLAVRAATALGAEPVITTATDAAGLPGLDALGWPAEGAIAAVSRALLDGEPVTLESDQAWPLPPLPVHRGPEAGQHTAASCRIVVTDRIVPVDGRTVVLRPPSLVVGVGASRGVTAGEVLGLLDRVLAGAGLSPASVAALATVDAKAEEPGLVEAVRQRGWPLITHPAVTLAAIPVPTPSQAALAAVGTPSVAEAAAMASAAELLVPKNKSAMATAAVARLRPRGRLAVVGLGPGARDLLTPRAAAELRRASVVVGLDQYLGQIRDLLRPGTRVLASGLGAEEERARSAVAQARQGHAVALVGSGDAGVYAMASPALAEAGDDIDVTVVPGVTASLAAAALLGAPLGHDHAVVSLSDLHTPWEVIERRVAAAAGAGFVTVFYNPRSRGRGWQLGAALAILARHRPPDTPAGVVRNASRPGEQVTLTTLAGLDVAAVDMLSIVVVGTGATRAVAGRMVTPRGYRWQEP